MADFPACQYGPMDLRPLLRARLEAGEKVVGWAGVRLGADPSREMAMAAASFMPIVGPAAASLLMHASHGVLIVTDRRVLALKGGRSRPAPSGRGVHFDAPIERLRVHRRRDGLITIRKDDTDKPTKPLRIRFVKRRRPPPPSERAVRALAVLAGDEPTSDV